MRTTTGETGFSLLEVLVAFVILALVGTALFRVFGGALSNVAAADDYTRALLVAESVLAEASSAQPLRDGSQAGATPDGRIEWKVAVTPYAAAESKTDGARTADAMPLRLWKVAVDVTFGAAEGKPRTLALATVRLGTRETQ